MKTSLAVRLFLALLMAMDGVNAQDTGDDIDFTASPLGDGDTTLAGRLVRWSVCDTTLIRRWTFEPRQSNHITYRALRAGTCRVSVTAGDVRRSSRVVIRP
jgi:hypothetical protein